MQKTTQDFQGYGYTYEQARWVCPSCGVIEPRKFPYGESYIKVRCACQKAQEEQQAREKASQEQQARLFKGCYEWLGMVTPDLRSLSFETYRADTDWQHHAVFQVSMYADIFVSGKNLILFGTHGTGKTHLLAALANCLIRRGVACRFATTPDLFEALQMKYQEHHTIIDKAIKTPLLILDDVDAARCNEFREETYFKIVNGRILRGLPTAISTNKMESLQLYTGEKVASRLKQDCLSVPMNGNDWRQSGGVK